VKLQRVAGGEKHPHTPLFKYGTVDFVPAVDFCEMGRVSADILDLFSVIAIGIS
jgi:hypothetical protein